MTDSVVGTRPGKRERLIASAMELLHHEGLHKPTLSEIAVAADVPPGNVYYYFKTRDDLVRAVLEARAEQHRTAFAAIEDLDDPGVRLKNFLDFWATQRDMMARYGCPVAGLTLELGKIGGELGDQAAALLRMRLDWTRTQLDLAGVADARALAITMVAGMEGAAVLAQALRDPEVITRETDRLKDWVDSVVAGGTGDQPAK